VRGRHRGLTLIELLITLVILSILAAAAVPYAEVTVTRTKEIELRRTLREVRTAIDRFHEDWASGKISKTSQDASDDGYPRTLEVLVDGTEGADAKGGKRRYLRRIPADPFGEEGRPPADQWLVRGYQDEPDTIMWNGKDVYDIRTQSERTALDGTRYRDW
jgi:general secretion pathway protein G